MIRRTRREFGEQTKPAVGANRRTLLHLSRAVLWLLGAAGSYSLKMGHSEGWEDASLLGVHI